MFLQPRFKDGKNLFDNSLNILNLFPLSAFKPNRLEERKKKKNRTRIFWKKMRRSKESLNSSQIGFFPRNLLRCLGLKNWTSNSFIHSMKAESVLCVLKKDLSLCCTTNMGSIPFFGGVRKHHLPLQVHHLWNCNANHLVFGIRNIWPHQRINIFSLLIN